MIKKIIYVLTLLSISVFTIVFLFWEKSERKEVVCWGDSLTAPAYKTNDVKTAVLKLIKGAKDYPDYLQGLLGSEYNVVNAGVPGQSSRDIMARQGSLPIFFRNDVVYTYDKSYRNHIGNEQDSVIVDKWGG